MHFSSTQRRFSSSSKATALLPRFHERPHSHSRHRVGPPYLFRHRERPEGARRSRGFWSGKTHPVPHPGPKGLDCFVASAPRNDGGGWDCLLPSTPGIKGNITACPNESKAGIKSRDNELGSANPRLAMTLGCAGPASPQWANSRGPPFVAGKRSSKGTDPSPREEKPGGGMKHPHPA